MENKTAATNAKLRIEVRRIFAAVLAALLLLASIAHADISGRVVAVTDGDIIKAYRQAKSRILISSGDEHL